jgi:hypothetical protein
VITRVGIVEWARRIDAARAAELDLADELGARSSEVAEVHRRLALVAAARAHGRHAELWKTVLPVLHDVAPDGTAALVIGGPGDDLAARLDVAYREWAAETSPVAEGPIARVLAAVLAEHGADATL